MWEFSSVQSLSHVWVFATPWTAARQAPLSITNSWSLLKLMSIESVMQETWVQSLGQEDLLEEGMETHSSILTWRNPWTEEPGGLQNLELQRCDWSSLAHMHSSFSLSSLPPKTLSTFWLLSSPPVSLWHPLQLSFPLIFSGATDEWCESSEWVMGLRPGLWKSKQNKSREISEGSRTGSVSRL